MFRREIRSLLHRLSRIRKGKFLGQEIELDEELKELQQGAVRAEEAASASPENLPTEEALPQDTAAEIFREAAKSPKAALLLLAAQLEKRVRVLFAATGWGLTV